MRCTRQGGAIALQVLHAGRYGYTPFSQSASDRKSPITPFRPSAMSTRQVDRTATAFAESAGLAKRAGYDAVEIMGSEGYLINQFLTARTNDRDDEWGGTPTRRMRFPVEVVRRTREVVGDGFPIIYRISLLDLVEDGQTWDEVVELALLVEQAGATVLNTGIGWHESRVPTIITQVPRGAWTWTTGRLRKEVGIPVCASNRINTPELAEQLIADGTADLVSMARPLLADPDFVNKAAAGRADEINTCIACNQACLDHAFKNKRASCLVNPRACHETELVLLPLPTTQPTARPTVAVVGAGPAGLSAATAYAERGFAVTLFEKDAELGGQFRLAMEIPGKEEFAETMRYYRRRLEVLGVTVRLGVAATVDDLGDFDEVVVATGVEPRIPAIPGIERALSYADVLSGEGDPGTPGGGDRCGRHRGRRLALAEPHPGRCRRGSRRLAGPLGRRRPGRPLRRPGRWWAHRTRPRTPAREVYLVQRKTTVIGKDLGKTSGWAHRAVLKQSGVEQISGATYERIDERGLHLTVDGEPRLLEVDDVVVCAGQESVRTLYDDLERADRTRGASRSCHLIGGADVAAELDAKRAIAQGMRVAAGA